MFQDYNFAISGESFQTLVPAIEAVSETGGGN